MDDEITVAQILEWLARGLLIGGMFVFFANFLDWFVDRNTPDIAHDPDLSQPLFPIWLGILAFSLAAVCGIALWIVHSSRTSSTTTAPDVDNENPDSGWRQREAAGVEGEIVRCANCGTKNRLRANAKGIPRCARCKTLLSRQDTGGAAVEETRVLGMTSKTRAELYGVAGVLGTLMSFVQFAF